MVKRAVGDRGRSCHQTVLRRLPRSCQHFRRDAIPSHPILLLLWTAIKWEEDRRRKTIEDAIHDLISVRMRANAVATAVVKDHHEDLEYDASPPPLKTFTSEYTITFSFFFFFALFVHPPPPPPPSSFFQLLSFLPSFVFSIQFLSVAQRGRQ